MSKKRGTYVSTQLGRIPRQKALKPAGRGCEELVMRVLDRRWQIVTGEIVKDLCQQDLHLGDDIDVGWRGAQEEGRGLTKEAEKGGDETIKDEVDLGVELVGSDLRAPIAEDGVGGLEDAEVDVVFRGGEGEDELLGGSQMGRWGRMGRTSMRSGHFEGKSSSATRATDSAICARMALSAGWARAIIAGSSCARSAALSCSGRGATSCAGQRRVWLDPTTHLLPSELCNVFEVDATCETNRAVGCAVEDEREEMRQKAGLGRELVQLLLGLFSRRWLQRRTEQRGDVRHGLSSVSFFHATLYRALFVTSY